jgi:hypothetical protein
LKYVDTEQSERKKAEIRQEMKLDTLYREVKAKFAMARDADEQLERRVLSHMNKKFSALKSDM